LSPRRQSREKECRGESQAGGRQAEAGREESATLHDGWSTVAEPPGYHPVSAYAETSLSIATQRQAEEACHTKENGRLALVRSPPVGNVENTGN
jgi:hypothetical protein